MRPQAALVPRRPIATLGLGDAMGMTRILVGLAAMWALSFGGLGCSGNGGGGVAGCPDDLVPCGNGCRPPDAVCCENQNAASSSYCTNAAGGGCYPNDRDCQAGFPLGAVAKFCCAETGTIGSNDCPAGQHHCGLLCQPVDEPCCEGGDCRYASSGPTCPEGRVVCAYDAPADICWTCSSGFCCGGPAITGGCFAGGGVCQGGTGGSDGGGSCPGGWLGSTQTCTPLGTAGEPSVCIQRDDFEAAGLPFPNACAPEGTTGCLNSMNQLVNPCCAGLKCASTEACGQQNAGIGECVQ